MKTWRRTRNPVNHRLLLHPYTFLSTSYLAHWGGVRQLDMSLSLVASLPQLCPPQSGSPNVLATHRTERNFNVLSAALSKHTGGRNYNYPGTGRVIGLIYECLGGRLEDCVSYLARRLGHGPEGTTMKLVSMMDKLRSRESPRPKDKDYIRSNFVKLLRYI